MNTSPRLHISPEEISFVVKQFYAQVRKDPALGPIFGHTIGSSPNVWEEHEEKITGFWRNVLLREKSYDGNPMLAHMGIGAIQPQHFEIWLGLFEKTLFEELEEHKAESWSRLAKRIGRGLRMGILSKKKDEFSPPDLR